MKQKKLWKQLDAWTLAASMAVGNNSVMVLAESVPEAETVETESVEAESVDATVADDVSETDGAETEAAGGMDEFAEAGDSSVDVSTDETDVNLAVQMN